MDQSMFGESKILHQSDNNNVNMRVNKAGFTMHVHPIGYWTKMLKDYVTRHGNVYYPIKIAGPYGSLSVDLSKYRHIIVISGGIGITPMIPILKQFREYDLSTRRKTYPLLLKITVIWAMKEKSASLIDDFADALFIGGNGGNTVGNKNQPVQQSGRSRGGTKALRTSKTQQ